MHASDTRRARLWLLTGLFVLGPGCTGVAPLDADGGSGDAAVGGTPDGGCASDADCGAGLSCETPGGTCVSLGCLTDGCPDGQRCHALTHLCVPADTGPHRLYRGVTIAGHAMNTSLVTRDAAGRSAFGTFELLVASRTGRFLVAVDSAVVMRVETTTGRVETLSGSGWPGEVDGPPGVAQFETNFYQNGGYALSPDERDFIFTSPHAVRRVDVETGEASTVETPFKARALAVGRLTGDVYLIDPAPTRMAVMSRDGGVELRPLVSAGGTVGYMVVDERRGLAYGLERNRQSGAFYRWSLDGGPLEWLNHEATGSRTPAQYLSDGPVANLEMANPGGLSIDAEGFVYIGAGDGNTFRRFDPERGIVESLCRVPSDGGDELFEWCIGDGVRNNIFTTWPKALAFDDSGNGFFGYSVWPRLVALWRLE